MAPRLLAAVFAVVSAAALVAQSPPARPALDITRITGNLYRGTAGGLHNVFLVTPDGIILADPINTPFATWLKAELAERFRVPVTYVIYSHGHYDHIEGGNVFADTAQFAAGLSQGKSLAELQDTLMLEKYKGWAGYDQRRRLNIEAAYNNLRLYR